MTRRAFERLVRQVLASLPAGVMERLNNVSIVVQDAPDAAMAAELGDDLLAVYLGVAMTERDSGYAMVEPDRIVLFQRAIENAAPDRGALRAEIKRTILHEVAHHFGISDEQLHAWHRY